MYDTTPASACYSWTRPCDAPPDPCGGTQPTQTTCADTQTWFWLGLVVVVGGAILFHSGRKRA
jgi:hypothetical protein